MSIWTVAGRHDDPVRVRPAPAWAAGPAQGESDLVYRDGRWFLYATVNVVEEPDGRGRRRARRRPGHRQHRHRSATGRVYSGAHLTGLRHRHRRLRQRLQRKGTRSARRRLKPRRRNEQRFAAGVNHTLSKRIVAEAQGTARGIALEELGGIRERVSVRESQRATLHSWAFDQLRQLIAYKAQLAGVPVVYVDPRNTSRTCPACGLVDKRNRRVAGTLLCVGVASLGTPTPSRP